MIELKLFADLAELLFPLALVRQGISVCAPKFLHHLALRYERTFRLGIFVDAVELLQRELGQAFDLGRYHEAVLSHGSIPVKYLPELVRMRLQQPR